MSSSLEAFVNEHKKKEEKSYFPSLGDLRSPFSSLSGQGDTESLVQDASPRGILPSNKNRKTWFSSDDNILGLSRTQRLFAFFLFLTGATFCFIMAVFLIPVLLFQARKFAALNALGSVLVLASFVFVWGPSAYLSMLFAPNRRLVTVCYLSSLFATLYSALWLRLTVFAVVASIFQAVSLVCFVLSSVPGGERGLRFLASFTSRVVSRPSSTVLPI